MYYRVLVTHHFIKNETFLYSAYVREKKTHFTHKLSHEDNVIIMLQTSASTWDWPFRNITLSFMMAFSSLARNFGQCLTIDSPPVPFFFKVENSLRTLNPLFMPESVHSGSAIWDDWGRMFPDKLCVSSFPDWFPYYAWIAQSAHSDFVGSWVSGCLGVTCRVHFWKNDWGLLCATAVTRGWNGHRRRISTHTRKHTHIHRHTHSDTRTHTRTYTYAHTHTH